MAPSLSLSMRANTHSTCRAAARHTSMAHVPVPSWSVGWDRIRWLVWSGHARWPGRPRLSGRLSLRRLIQRRLQSDYGYKAEAASVVLLDRIDDAIANIGLSVAGRIRHAVRPSYGLVPAA